MSTQVVREEHRGLQWVVVAMEAVAEEAAEAMAAAEASAAGTAAVVSAGTAAVVSAGTAAGEVSRVLHLSLH